MYSSFRRPPRERLRKQEYVASAAGAKPMGGVQCFKLGLHGGAIAIAGMVGYVQNDTCLHWFAEVNRWIDELASAAESSWSSKDRLHSFSHDPGTRVARSESEHLRVSAVSPNVRLVHLWVEMS